LRSGRKAHAKARRRKEETGKKGAREVHENDLATKIVDVGFQIHKKLGPGLLESAYQIVFVHELTKLGLAVESEVSIPLKWDDLYLTTAFRADLIIDRIVIVEIKSIEQIAPVHKKQLLTYLRLTDMRLGLLINFGMELFKDGVSRVANGLQP
jgi:GxxExxY protein